MTTWYPDTDDCAIIISDELATRGQIMGFVPGKESKKHANPAAVQAHNRTKSNAVADVEAVIATEAGSEYSWWVAEDGVIEINVTGLPSGKRNTLQNAINTKYPGQVRLIF